MKPVHLCAIVKEASKQAAYVYAYIVSGSNEWARMGLCLYMCALMCSVTLEHKKKSF